MSEPPPAPPPGRATPPARVDVVVVGAGVIGTSIAWHLATRSDLRVAVVDKGTVGGGSTSRSAAAFRQQFSSVEHVRMSVYSADAYRRFPETLGVDPVFVQNGYLFLYTRADDLEAAARRVALQHELGVTEAAVLTPAGVDALPGLGGVYRIDHLAGATWCPSDGFLRPTEIASGYADAAAARGVTFLPNRAITAIETTAGRVAGVVVDGRHRVACDALVVAAGWWSTFVSGLAGCPIPVVAVKRYLYVTPQLRGRRVEHFPLTVCDLGPYTRPEHNGLMMGWDERPSKPAGSDHFPSPGQDEAVLETAQDVVEPGFGRGIEDYGVEVLARIAEFIPFLEDEGAVEHATCGYYEITPDDKAILGPDPRLDGLWHASGFSGHGIMHAPAAGRAIADLLVGQEPPFAMEGFSLDPLLRDEMRPDAERMVI